MTDDGARSKWLAGTAPCRSASATSASMPATLAAISRLFVHFPARTPTTFTAVSDEQRRRGRDPDADRPERHERSIHVRRKENRHGRERSAVDDEQQRDAVEEPDDRRIRALQVDVLSADFRKTRCELRPHEAADERDRAADRPHQENQNRIGDDARDVRRVGENADADDAAGDHDDGVEEAELAAKAGFG